MKTVYTTLDYFSQVKYIKELKLREKILKEMYLERGTLWVLSNMHKGSMMGMLLSSSQVKKGIPETSQSVVCVPAMRRHSGPVSDLHPEHLEDEKEEWTLLTE